jgi:Putative adhesin
MRLLPAMALAVVMVTGSALVIAGCGTRMGSTTAQNSYTITEPVTSLKINNPVGNTEIEGTDAATVSVIEQLRYSGEPPQTSYPIVGGQLALSYTCPGRLDGNSCSVTYVVKVPRRLAVEIEGKVGLVRLTGLAGQLTLNSSTGNIDATGLTSAAVTAQANAGAITLEFVAPPTTVNAEAQVGAITVRLPAGTAYAVDANSQVGTTDVMVQRDPSSPHRVTVHSRVGSVSVRNG